MNIIEAIQSAAVEAYNQEQNMVIGQHEKQWVYVGEQEDDGFAQSLENVFLVNSDGLMADPPAEEEIDELDEGDRVLLMEYLDLDKAQ